MAKRTVALVWLAIHGVLHGLSLQTTSAEQDNVSRKEFHIGSLHGANRATNYNSARRLQQRWLKANTEARRHSSNQLSQQRAQQLDAANNTTATQNVSVTQEEVPTYASYYKSDSQRPNVCKVAHQSPPTKEGVAVNFTGHNHYIPFIGTSLVRDSQLLLLRLYYSIDYPVKNFLLVVSERTYNGHNAMSYQIKHMKEFPLEQVGLVVITCDHQPSVSESWNAVFHTFPKEPWGLYMARDTWWERGSLAKLAEHGWEASKTGSVDVGFVKWSNMPNTIAHHNIFVMTRQALNRYGLWDENIYPAYVEDWDMMARAARMNPPLKEHLWEDVFAVHQARAQKSYRSGINLADDPVGTDDKNITALTWRRDPLNHNYFYRKWGCSSEGRFNGNMKTDCKYQTPFNKPVPVWYWETSKEHRRRDRHVVMRGAQIVDEQTNEVIINIPPHYGNWTGYNDTSGFCRVTGTLAKQTMGKQNSTEGTVCI